MTTKKFTAILILVSWCVITLCSAVYAETGG